MESTLREHHKQLNRATHNDHRPPVQKCSQHTTLGRRSRRHPPTRRPKAKRAREEAATQPRLRRH